MEARVWMDGGEGGGEGRMEGCVAEIRRYGERKEEVEEVEEGRLIVSRLLFRPVDEERKRVRESPPPPHPSFLDHRRDKTVNQRDTSQLSEPAGVGVGGGVQGHFLPPFNR